MHTHCLFNHYLQLVKMLVETTSAAAAAAAATTTTTTTSTTTTVAAAATTATATTTQQKCLAHVLLPWLLLFCNQHCQHVCCSYVYGYCYHCHNNSSNNFDNNKSNNNHCHYYYCCHRCCCCKFILNRRYAKVLRVGGWSVAQPMSLQSTS